jgi:cobalt-precorrin-7 (C5)-methyltransferase
MAVMKRHFLVIAGCGPGSPEYLTPAVVSAVQWAEVLVGARRLLDLFPESPAEKIVADADVEKVLREIEVRRGMKRIAVLVTGDPGLCSLARPVVRRFGREACVVIPGVSSVQVAFARIGIDWLGAKIIDAHGQDPGVAPDALADEGKVAVLAGRKEAFPWISRLAARLGNDYRIYLCEDLTLPGEKVRLIDAEALSVLDPSPRSIVLFVREDCWT